MNIGGIVRYVKKPYQLKNKATEHCYFMVDKYEYSVVLCCLIKSSSYTWSRVVSNNEHRDLTMCQMIAL